jgi:hypothetical protein
MLYVNSVVTDFNIFFASLWPNSHSTLALTLSGDAGSLQANRESGLHPRNWQVMRSRTHAVGSVSTIRTSSRRSGERRSRASGCGARERGDYAGQPGYRLALFPCTAGVGPARNAGVHHA